VGEVLVGVSQAIVVESPAAANRRQRHAGQEAMGVAGDVIAGEQAAAGPAQRGVVIVSVGVGGKTGGRSRRLVIPLFFGRPGIAVGEQPAEIGVAGRIGSPDDDRRGVYRLQVGSDQELDSGLFGGAVSPHDAGECGPVGDGEGLVAEFGRSGDECLGMGGSLQERKVARAVKLGVTRGGVGHGCAILFSIPVQALHANTPWRYQVQPRDPRAARPSRRKSQNLAPDSVSTT